MTITAPFPWFGGKSRVAPQIWERFGDVPNYVEPFAGSLAVWGICLHIGGGFADGIGPWMVRDGEMVDKRDDDLSNAGQGINRQMPHLGDAGRGINRQMPHLGDAGRGIETWFIALAERLRRVRVCSGDWARVVSESVTTRHGLTGVLLDPPYGDEIKQTRVYATDSGTVSDDVREWCRENGNDRLLRIALCGYEGEGHDALLDYGWTAHAWRTPGGYGGGRGGTGDENRHRERIYFSPHCVAADAGLFDLFTEEPA